MTKTILFYRNSLLPKLFMLVMLLVGGGNNAWGDQTIFAGKVASGWQYTNSASPTPTSLTPTSSGELYEGGQSNSPRRYTSTSNITISAGQVIVVKARKSSDSNSNNPNIKVYLSSDNGISWGEPIDEIVKASLPSNAGGKNQEFVIDGLEVGSYMIRFEFTWVYINSIVLEDPVSCAKIRNLESSSITYNSATLTWESLADNFQLKYAKEGGSDSEPIPVDATSYKLSGLEDYQTYYVYVRSDCGGGEYGDWRSVSFTTLQQYPKPTNFVMTAKSAITSTFNWTKGSSETAWQLVYDTNPDFDPNTEGTTKSFSSKPYTLDGLTENTTYYAYLRADYGSSHYSRWTDKLEFMPTSDITINEGTNKSYQVPFHGSYVNKGESSENVGQIIVPSTKLTGIVGRQIRKMKFYSEEENVNWGAGFDVYIKNVAKTSYASGDEVIEPMGTKVVTSKELSVSDGIMQVDFDLPYNYSSGSLLITLVMVEKGSVNKSAYWLGTGVYESAYKYYNGSATIKSRNYFAPKITFVSVPTVTAPVKIGSTGFTTFASSYPLDFTSSIDGLTAYYVASGDVDAEKAKLTEVTSKVSAGTGLILKGTAGTTYYIPVAASGSDLSGNLMVGCTSETVLTTSASKYVLVNNSGTPEFQDLSENGATIPAGKAYLNATGAGSRLSIVFDDPVVTGIAVSKVAERSSNGIVYNLMGQKVVKPSNGLYVINGKKVIKK